MSGDPNLRHALQVGLQGDLVKYAACPDRFKCGRAFRDGECHCSDLGVHSDLCGNVNPFVGKFPCHCAGTAEERHERATRFLATLNGEPEGKTQ